MLTYKDIDLPNNYLKFLEKSADSESQNFEQEKHDFFQKISNSLDILFKGDYEGFKTSILEIEQILSGLGENQIKFYDELFIDYLNNLMKFNFLHENFIKIYILQLLQLYFRKIEIHNTNYSFYSIFEQNLFDLLEFEKKEEDSLFINALITDCICQLIRSTFGNSKFINLIRPCFYKSENIPIDQLTQLKLIMFLSKFGLLSNFKYKKINKFISIAIDTFLFNDDDQNEKYQEICFVYLNEIYTNDSYLVAYIKEEYIQKFIDIINNQKKYSEIALSLILVILKEFENNNSISLIHIIQELNMDYILELVDAENSNVVNLALEIIAISIRTQPKNFIAFSKSLWEKIIFFYYEFQLKTKSLAINCLTYILNPKIEISYNIILDSRIYQIIIDHLQLHILDDVVNILFILQSFICISIKTNQEKELRNLFEKNELKDIIEEMQYDEIGNELNDDSIENILYFITQINSN